MAENAALKLRDVSIRRGGALIVDALSFHAARGEVTAILGPNGAGKSTVLKAAAGLLPYSGALTTDGVPLAALSPRDRARRVAYVPQHSALEAAVPARAVVAQGRFAHRPLLGGMTRADEDAVERALAATDTTALADRPFHRLSYGERRLVLLARAFATEAPVLLLDEPTAALDVRHALQLLALLRRRAREGRCVVVVLHQLQEAVESCDRAVLMARGRVVASGGVREVVSDGPIRSVYGVRLVERAHFGYELAEEPR